ncbi:hypothetical protein NP493_740g01014 [Ridgeia piscesae]|uniref:Uncharacterized protein n=1 Tax=Ridgeia piscesae TaxID=27915 RepID=A0AAD9NMB9_RIDPI|nr:hypothetical protein NP493_740g01014 [Ridgeia piscesae]
MGSSGHLGASWRTWTLRMTSLSSHTAINRCRKKELLNRVSTQIGLNINRSKTRIMKANTKNNNPTTLKGEPLEKTDSFTYLGSTIKKWRHRRRRQSKDTESKSCIHHVEKNLESKTNQN